MRVGYSAPLNSDTVVSGVAPSSTLSGKPLQGTRISLQMCDNFCKQFILATSILLIYSLSFH